MIISLNIENENTYYKIFEAVTIVFAKLNSNIKNINKGRPRKYSDQYQYLLNTFCMENLLFLFCFFHLLPSIIKFFL